MPFEAKRHLQKRVYSTRWSILRLWAILPRVVFVTDPCSGSVCKLAHIYLDNAALAYLNIQFQKT